MSVAPLYPLIAPAAPLDPVAPIASIHCDFLYTKVEPHARTRRVDYLITCWDDHNLLQGRRRELRRKAKVEESPKVEEPSTVTSHLIPNRIAPLLTMCLRFRAALEPLYKSSA